MISYEEYITQHDLYVELLRQGDITADECQAYLELLDEKVND